MINYSIIIPHRNIPKLLQRCLDYIPYRDDVQIIVVDDNSDPQVVDFDNFPGMNIPNVEVYFTKEGKGAGYARNVGIEHVKGKWVFFADADDYFSKAFLSTIDTLKESKHDLIYFGSRCVDAITKEWLGAIGGVLAILGVIAAPITSGDTAFRSARLIVADFLGMEQKSMRCRLYICIPMFVLAIGLLLYSLRDANGFNMIWRYFAWANQTLAVFTLWAITVFLAVSKKTYIITLIPALFMTCVCSTYICIAPEGLGLSSVVSYSVGIACVVIAVVWFYAWLGKQKTRKLSE